MSTENKLVLELLETSASLISGDKILELGQRVFVTGVTDALSYPIKIGDGVTAYTALKWQEYKLLKTIDLTSADVTYTLPKIIGGPQRVDVYWTNGGTYKMTLAVANSETIGGIAAAIWLGEGTGHAVIVSDGTNWQVEVYEDIIEVAASGINTARTIKKHTNGTVTASGGWSTTADVNNAWTGWYRSPGQALLWGYTLSTFTSLMALASRDTAPGLFAVSGTITGCSMYHYRSTTATAQLIKGTWNLTGRWRT